MDFSRLKSIIKMAPNYNLINSNNLQMKNILLLLSLFLLPILTQGQSRSVKNFYHTFKKYEGARGIALPRVLVWMGRGIIKKAISDESPEGKVFMKFAKKFKSMKVLYMEDENIVSKEDLKNLMQGARRDRYEDIITVKSDGATISIMGQTKRKKLKNLMIIVSSEDEFVMLNARTNISSKDVNKLISELLEIEKVKKKFKEKEIEEPAEITPPPTKDKKKKKKPIRA